MSSKRPRRLRPNTKNTLRLLVDGAEVASVSRPVNPLDVSAQAVFDARYQQLLDNPATHNHAVENAARAAAMSELLGAQDVTLERMARQSRKRPARQRKPGHVIKFEPGSN